jgi:sporulation protein YlmC with PRC-barrel domain
MKVFATELQGKVVMSSDGKLLGDVDNIVINTANGDIKHMLLRPGEDIDPRDYKTDRNGRIVLPFNKVKSVKDVIVLGPLEGKKIEKKKE